MWNYFLASYMRPQYKAATSTSRNNFGLRRDRTSKSSHNQND